MDHHEVLRRQRDQGALRRGKARRVEYAAVNVFDLVILPVVAATIFRQDDVLKGCPQGLARYPEQHPRVGEALFQIKVVTMQGDTAVSVRDPWEQTL